jgi:hypothetical protein
VTFYNGSTAIGTGTLVPFNASGTVTLNYTGLTTAGTYSITATYNGSTNTSTSTSPVLTQTVN